MALRLNIPPITRALLVLLLTLSILSASLRFRPSEPILRYNPNGVPFLSLVPDKSIEYPWVVLTAAFIEHNLFSLSASGLTIFFGGRYLERAWGSSEYVKFLLFVTMIPNILAFVVYWLWYALTGDESRASTTINGALALEAAFLVAFKQLVPEHTVSIFRSLIRIRVKHFPAILVLLNTLSGPVLGTDTALFLGWFGFLTSWIYLRFFRLAPSLSTSATGEGAMIKGDASDTFAFSHFFPDQVQVVLAPLCDSIYNAMIAARICSPFSEEAVDTGNEQASARAEGGLPSLMNPSSRGGRAGGRREEAERRRALALRALDERLNAAAVNRASSGQTAPQVGSVSTATVEQSTPTESTGHG